VPGPAPTKKPKVRKKRKGKKRQRQPCPDVLPPSFLAMPSATKLDSVFLQWRLRHKQLKELSASKLVAIFQKEVARFKAYGRKKCKKVVHQFRYAFELVTKDPAELADMKAESDPRKVRNIWVALVSKALEGIKFDLDNPEDFEANSFVGGFLSSLPSASTTHPPGELRVEDQQKLPELIDISDSDTDTSSSDDEDSDEYSVSSSEDEAKEAAPAAKKPRKAMDPQLTVDSGVREHLRSIRKAKDIKDLHGRTVDWISDTFCNGSTHIGEITAGKHRDLAWSRAQLSKVCGRIIALYDKVALREKTADHVSRKAKKAQLKSEFVDFANIRTRLHVIRLGEVRADRYDQKVEDEDARADFELVSGSSRSYKIFSKELSASQKDSSATPARPVVGARSRQPYSRPRGGRGSARRTVMRSAGGRGRRGHRPPRNFRFVPLAHRNVVLTLPVIPIAEVHSEIPTRDPLPNIDSRPTSVTSAQLPLAAASNKPRPRAVPTGRVTNTGANRTCNIKTRWYPVLGVPDLVSCSSSDSEPDDSTDDSSGSDDDLPDLAACHDDNSDDSSDDDGDVPAWTSSHIDNCSDDGLVDDDDVPGLISCESDSSSSEDSNDDSSDDDEGATQTRTSDSGITGSFHSENFNLPRFSGAEKHGDLVLGNEDRPIDYDVMAAAVRPSWLRSSMTHSEIAAAATAAVDPVKPRSRREERATNVVEYDHVADRFVPWPRRTTDPPSPPPPSITAELVRAVVAQDALASPDLPYPPALQSFVTRLEQWRQQLTTHFRFSDAVYADNTRAAADRIAERIAFLPRARRQRVMDVVRNGYTIPFTETPPPFHRASNSPDLSEHMDAAWTALKKDIGHGAVAPCNLPKDGKPKVVSPVRTAPKGWRTGKRRFVINMRYLNKLVPEAESSCSLETLSRIRNLLSFPGANSNVTWSVTMDLASGYHNFWIAPAQWTYMGFALHRSELPAEAITWLRENCAHCEDPISGNFYFIMRALGFGLGPSCAIFSLIITSLSAAWRRHRVCTVPLRLTSYIDDFLAICMTARQAMIAAIELVYEATAAGLTISVEKCRLGPTTRTKYLGVIIDSRTRLFRLPIARIQRIRTQITEIQHSLQSTDVVPSRTVAQLVGLLWAITPCCQRAVCIMARGLIALLTKEMASQVWRKAGPKRSTFTLKRLMSAFWEGDVVWSAAADRDLRFWAGINFATLRGPISADTLEVMASSIRVDTSAFKHKHIAFLASDASETACGGGLLHGAAGSFSFDPRGAFFSPLTPELLGESSGLREITSIAWMLEALTHALPRRVVVFTDSQVACAAISRGSKVDPIQDAARRIFVWSLRHGVCVFPCWAPRASPVIEMADARSRWRDTYDSPTPKEVFLAADAMAVRLWGANLSFDRQASHTNAMPPQGWGPRLPYNALWNQPGCAGVDMFLQPLASWREHVNFIHPAMPTIGRVLTFLPATQSRAVVVFPERLADAAAWWSNLARVGAPGVLRVRRHLGFLVLALDHSPNR